ncbi:conserved protein of unknown function [Bradyrhizobium vignae]|uniref:Uncharacterized protein n=1 Tax=Bradyrhizobium vignae TaxID=1549949 RepID=A0A2U3PUX8_9BRAD|nr:conserved protein of unknown function [Bradyrhizobium vignae]
MRLAIVLRRATLLPLRHLSCSFYGSTDAGIGSASAEIPTHRIGDLSLGGLGRLRQKCGCCHHLSGLTVAALRYLMVDPGLLNDVRVRRRSEALDRCDVAANFSRGDRARAHRRTVDMNRACATKACAATVLRPQDAKLVPEHPKERHFRFDVQIMFLTVDGQLHCECSCDKKRRRDLSAPSGIAID